VQNRQYIDSKALRNRESGGVRRADLRDAGNTARADAAGVQRRGQSSLL